MKMCVWRVDGPGTYVAVNLDVSKHTVRTVKEEELETSIAIERAKFN